MAKKQLVPIDMNGNSISNVVLDSTSPTAFFFPGFLQPYPAKVAPAGWLLADGAAVSRSTYAALYAVLCPSGAVTFDITTEIATKSAHGLVTGDSIFLTSTGTLPTGLTANTIYYVIYIDANTFYLATTFALANGGAANKIMLSGANGSGHTLTFCPYGLGNGSTTFNTPAASGKTLVGINSTDPEFDTLGISAVGEKSHTLIATEMQHTNASNRTSGIMAAGGNWGNNAVDTGVISVVTATAHNNIQPTLVVTYIIKT